MIFIGKSYRKKIQTEKVLAKYISNKKLWILWSSHRLHEFLWRMFLSSYILRRHNFYEFLSFLSLPLPSFLCVIMYYFSQRCYSTLQFLRRLTISEIKHNLPVRFLRCMYLKVLGGACVEMRFRGGNTTTIPSPKLTRLQGSRARSQRPDRSDHQAGVLSTHLFLSHYIHAAKGTSSRQTGSSSTLCFTTIPK